MLSGIVVAPDSPAPAAGRAVVGWGHPTTGAAASCAPSNGVDPYLLVEGLPDLIRAGYVVVAPDYPGMGVPAPSSYLIGTSESRSLLDAVRAARELPTGATTTTVLWGHSQGGHAVLFAALQAGTYAPELTVRAALAAPAADLGTLLDDDIGDVSGVTIGSYAFAAYQQAYAAQYPGLEGRPASSRTPERRSPRRWPGSACSATTTAARYGDATARQIPAHRPPDHRALVGDPRREHPRGHRPRDCRCSSRRAAPTPW